MSELGEEQWRAVVEAGFLDAYLNIRGVEDEAEAEAMVRRDFGELAASGWVLTDPEAAMAFAKVVDRYVWDVDHKFPTTQQLRDFDDMRRALAAYREATKIPRSPEERPLDLNADQMAGNNVVRERKAGGPMTYRTVAGEPLPQGGPE